MTILLLLFYYWGSHKINEPVALFHAGNKISEEIRNETMKIAHYSEGSPSGFIVIDSGNKDFFIRTNDSSTKNKFAKKYIAKEICLSYRIINYDSDLILYYYIDSYPGDCLNTKL